MKKKQKQAIEDVLHKMFTYVLHKMFTFSWNIRSRQSFEKTS